jgi:hypothetical protein
MKVALFAGGVLAVGFGPVLFRRSGVGPGVALFCEPDRPGAPGDFDLFKSDVGRTANLYYASNRAGGFGGDDLYRFSPLMPTIAQVCGDRIPNH